MALIGQRCCGTCAHFKSFGPPIGDGKARVCAEGPIEVAIVPKVFRFIPPGANSDMPAGGAEVVMTQNVIIPRFTPHPDYVCGRWKSQVLDAHGGITN